MNACFTLLDPTNNTIQSVRRGVDINYAQAYADYVVNGGKNIDELIRLNPAVQRYISDKHVEGHAVNYGQRIAAQTNDTLKLLKEDSGTRRAVIQILLPEDTVIAHTKHATMEYPCCKDLHFMLREGKLNLTVNMRSQNLPLVLVYDVYNFTAIQMFMCKELGVSPGFYHHNMDSAHVYAKEFDLTSEILFEYTKQYTL